MKAKPTIWFDRPYDKESWQMMSLRERLRTVEKDVHMMSGNWAKAVNAHTGLQREFKKL